MKDEQNQNGLSFSLSNSEFICSFCVLTLRTGRGEVPVGRGALDETFDLAFDTEQKTAAGKPQAGVFLDC
eukprot:661780-Amphidinium_carterae.1